MSKGNRSERGESDGCFTIIFLLVLVLVGLSTAIYGWSTQRTFVGTVDKTYVDRGNTYFVISEKGVQEAMVYENEDAWFFWKWTSGNVLRDVNVGQSYTFHVYGWRVPFLSWYPNIIKATRQQGGSY